MEMAANSEVNHHREELMNGLQRHAQVSRC